MSLALLCKYCANLLRRSLPKRLPHKKIACKNCWRDISKCDRKKGLSVSSLVGTMNHLRRDTKSVKRGKNGSQWTYSKVSRWSSRLPNELSSGGSTEASGCSGSSDTRTAVGVVGFSVGRWNGCPEGASKAVRSDRNVERRKGTEGT